MNVRSTLAACGIVNLSGAANEIKLRNTLVRHKPIQAGPVAGNPQVVIEIGTNSVKLLVATVRRGGLFPLDSAARVTRLGESLDRSGRLHPAAISRTVQVVSEFAHQARQFRPARIQVITTSAGREAPNQLELFRAIAQAAQLDVRAVSGEQEAEWAYRGVASDPALVRQPLLVVDLGGGSMEVILGEGAFIYQRRSFPIGCLRLLNQLKSWDPPSARSLRRCRSGVAARLNRDVVPVVFPMLKSACGRAITPVAVGGTARVLADLCCGPVASKAVEISLRDVGFDRLGTLIERLWSMTLGERRSLRDLPSDRADTILTGSVVFHEFMRCFGFERLHISLRGVRYGALLERPPDAGLVPELPSVSAVS